MTRTEGFSAIWLILFNFHFGITKPNRLDLIALLCHHNKLFSGVVGRSLRFVESAYACAF
jgi:hypothetical protein